MGRAAAAALAVGPTAAAAAVCATADAAAAAPAFAAGQVAVAAGAVADTAAAVTALVAGPAAVAAPALLMLMLALMLRPVFLLRGARRCDLGKLRRFLRAGEIINAGPGQFTEAPNTRVMELGGTKGVQRRRASGTYVCRDRRLVSLLEKTLKQAAAGNPGIRMSAAQFRVWFKKTTQDLNLL